MRPVVVPRRERAGSRGGSPARELARRGSRRWIPVARRASPARGGRRSTGDRCPELPGMPTPLPRRRRRLRERDPAPPTVRGRPVMPRRRRGRRPAPRPDRRRQAPGCRPPRTGAPPERGAPKPARSGCRSLPSAPTGPVRAGVVARTTRSDSREAVRWVPGGRAAAKLRCVPGSAWRWPRHARCRRGAPVRTRSVPARGRPALRAG